MAVPTNTHQTYDSGLIYEDLSSKVSAISPTETPFQTAISTSKAEQTHHEWSTVDLAAASDSNTNVEGDDATNDAPTTGVRVGNYTQISDKVAQVSGSAEVANSPENQTRLAKQVFYKMQELKRDCEKQILSNKASVAGTTSVARQSGSLSSWLETNVDVAGTGGVAGGYNSGTGLTVAPTDGTLEALTEAKFIGVVQSAWTEGGNPSIAFMAGAMKSKITSTFTGYASKQREADKTISAATDLYVSDFGDIRLVADRFARASSVEIIDPARASVAMYRGMRSDGLAKTGDSMRKQILHEYCLHIDNEKAHAGVYGINPAL